VGIVKKALNIKSGMLYAVKTVKTRDEETILNVKLILSDYFAV